MWGCHGIRGPCPAVIIGNLRNSVGIWHTSVLPLPLHACATIFLQSRFMISGVYHRKTLKEYLHKERWMYCTCARIYSCRRWLVQCRIFPPVIRACSTARQYALLRVVPYFTLRDGVLQFRKSSVPFRKLVTPSAQPQVNAEIILSNIIRHLFLLFLFKLPCTCASISRMCMPLNRRSVAIAWYS